MSTINTAYNSVTDSCCGQTILAIEKLNSNTEVLKPVEGKKLEGEVCMIYPAGILLNIQNTLKILIPTTTLKNYIFNQNENYFIHKKTKNKIKVGDNISVVISGAKYTKKSFSCFGNLYTEEAEEDIPVEPNVEEIVKSINNKKELKNWSLKNHPDKGGDTTIFQEVYSLVEKKLSSKKK